MISLYILAENTARGMGIIGEHGLSYWIDTGTHRLLFDTGQGLALFHNALRLGIDLAKLDAVVLSHGHYDHTGGLEQVLAMAPTARLFLHPDAIAPKFSGRNGRLRSLSLPYITDERFRTSERAVVLSREPTEVVPGIWMTGEIPRTNDYEDTGGPFFLDETLRKLDTLLDDQSLFFETEKGLVVVLGCAHSGVINTLHHIMRLAGHSRIHMVVGGMHLESASPYRMNKTVEALRSLSPERIGCCHCTGFAATVRLASEFKNHCFQACAGMRFDFF